MRCSPLLVRDWSSSISESGLAFLAALTGPRLLIGPSELRNQPHGLQHEVSRTLNIPRGPRTCPARGCSIAWIRSTPKEPAARRPRRYPCRETWETPVLHDQRRRVQPQRLADERTGLSIVTLSASRVSVSERRSAKRANLLHNGALNTSLRTATSRYTSSLPDEMRGMPAFRTADQSYKTWESRTSSTAANATHTIPHIINRYHQSQLVQKV